MKEQATSPEDLPTIEVVEILDLAQAVRFGVIDADVKAFVECRELGIPTWLHNEFTGY